MQPLPLALAFFLALASAWADSAAAEMDTPSARQELRKLQELIGVWRAAGNPEGSRAEKQKGFWTESLTWEWQFKGQDAWLKLAVKDGKHFRRGELCYVPGDQRYELRLWTPADEALTFTGVLQDRQLVVERLGPAKETQRLVWTLLHANRLLYRAEVREDGKTLFRVVYRVGATKEGTPFAAAGGAQPECVVSGGLGTMPVTHQGKTYYVCCRGCRDAFKEDPEKYIRESEEAKKKPDKSP